MVRYFIGLGHQAYLITSIYHDSIEVLHANDIPRDHGYVYSDDKKLGIPVIRVDSYLSKWPPRRVIFRDFIRTLERIVNDFKLNVLITHSTLWNGPEETAKFVEWRRNIRNLGGYHDPIIFCHMSHFQEPSTQRYSLLERAFRMAWNKFSLRQIIRAANLIIVVTPHEAQIMEGMGANGENIFLFPGGIDDQSFLRYSLEKAKIQIQDIKVPEAKIVTYLGSIEERKNPLAVLEVAKRLTARKDIHFVIAGRGESEYAESVKELAGKLPNVTYLGEITEDEKVQLIKASYINIIMSKIEALGLTQLEFMYFGVPVITSATGGQAWLVRHDEEGIHINGPNDIEGAAKAIESLIDNPAKWERLSKNSTNRARLYTLSNLIRKLDEALTIKLQIDSGLSSLPSEVLATIHEPEQVIKTFSYGAEKIVLTNRRLFLQRGKISRNTLEIPLKNLALIEHVSRYPWKTVLASVILTVLFLLEPVLRPVIPLLSSIYYYFKAAINFVLLNVGVNIPPAFPPIIPLIPALIGLLTFALFTRIGFRLLVKEMKPIFLPYRFKDCIKDIRELIDARNEANP